MITLIITSVSKNSFAAPPCSGDSWVFHKQGKKSKSKKHPRTLCVEDFQLQWYDKGTLQSETDYFHMKSVKHAPAQKTITVNFKQDDDQGRGPSSPLKLFFMENKEMLVLI